MCVAALPYEADTPLIVYPNTVLTPSLPTEGLQAIAWRRTEIRKPFSSIYLKELPERDSLELLGECLAAFTEKQLLALLVPETPDHF